MKPFFKELFEYSHHFNQQLAEACNNSMDKISPKVIELFSHILNAHRIWNNRIEPGQTAFGVWEKHPVQQYAGIDRMNFERSLLILEKFSLDDMIHYTNTRGQAFHNSVRDMLFHVINHSTYHRGQIATELRKSGIEPVVTDYIFYKR